MQSNTCSVSDVVPVPSPPRVSVIIASYNHAPFIGEAIASVLGQSYQDLEVVVTDDGSADGAAEVVRGIADPRVRLEVFPENRGACVAMNRCIERSRGELIAVLNSDDAFEPDKLARQVALLDARPDLGAVFARPLFVDERGAPFDDATHKDYLIFDVDDRSCAEWLRHFFYLGNALCHPTLLIRRSCYEAVGRYDPRLAQVPDLDMWIRLVSRFEIFVQPERLTRFRILDGQRNASAARPEVVARDEWERERLLRHFLDLPPDLFDDAFAADLARLGLCGDDRRVQLAGLAMDAGGAFHRRFALALLFDALGDAPDARGLPSYRDFVRLTGDRGLSVAASESARADTVASHHPSGASVPPAVSVIIRTKNEAKHLGQVLESLKAQVYEGPVEIVLVDSGSTDDTVSIAEAFDCTIVQIRPAEFSFGRALNVGIERAGGEIMVHLSGHSVPERGDYLSLMVEPFADPAVAATFGRDIPWPGTCPSQARDILSHFPDALPDGGKFSNANAAIRKSEWWRIRFDEGLPACEDLFWARDVMERGGQIRYVPDARVFHSHSPSPWYYYKRYRNERSSMKALLGYPDISLRDLARNAWWQIRRDFRFMRESGYSRWWYLHVPPFRIAQEAGLYVGSRIADRRASGR
jgi:glycosyltransferase involved in cell wall biosynthesis